MSREIDENFFDIIIETRKKRIPFGYVIEMTTGYRVIPLSKEDETVLDEIYKAALDIVKEAREILKKGKRINEISNDLEKRLREKLKGRLPSNKVAGYPNIEIERNGKTYYIEVKLAGISELNSSFRAFFYEPVERSSSSKITKDASHILVGFIHSNRERIVGFKIVDLSKVNVRLKAEFNTSNRELYKDQAIVRKYPKTAFSV